MNTVETNFDRGVLAVIFNRPESFNALNWEMLNELKLVFQSMQSDPNVRCVTLEGKGGNFMAGGDINYFHSLLDEDASYRQNKLDQLISEVHQLVEDIAHLPVPVVAKVQGAAAGFGISLVASCDLAVGSETSIYTSAYNLLGTSPDGGSTYYLPRSIGMKKAMEVVLTTKRYSALEALQMGLINEYVADDQLDEKVASMTQFIARSAKTAVENAKQLIRQSFNNDLASQLEAEQKLFLNCASTNDFAEGVRAFVEKRKATFSL